MKLSLTIVWKRSLKKTEEDESDNSGQLIVDAACAPAYIRYPTDISLLNQGREFSENVIGYVVSWVKRSNEQARRFLKYCQKSFLSYTKKRRPGAKARRSSLR